MAFWNHNITKKIEPRNLNRKLQVFWSGREKEKWEKKGERKKKKRKKNIKKSQKDE